MAEEKKEEGKEGEGAAAPAPKSKKKLIIIIGVVVVLLAVVGAVLLLGGKKADPAAEAEKEEVKHYATFEIPAIIVNLSDSTAFLKVSMLVEYDPEIIAKAESASGGSGGGHGGGASGGEEGGDKGGGFPGPMAARAPMIKDAIIRVLSAKKSDELLTSDGKERLKEELIEAINEASAMEEGPIVGIYFTEFLIQ